MFLNGCAMGGAACDRDEAAMTRIWASIRSWGSAFATTGLWVVVAAVAGVVFLMWIAGTGFLPGGARPSWQRASSAQPAPNVAYAPPRGVCQGRGCPAPVAVESRGYEVAAQGYEPPPVVASAPPRGVCQGRGCPAPEPVESRGYEVAAQGYEPAPGGACVDDGPPPWGAPVWKECGIRCMYERLRNGFCGPGCDYYYFRMHEYKPRKFYQRKPCYRVP
jgi:hypothetical protein